MYKTLSFPQLERQLRSYNYKPFYNPLDEEAITSEICPTCSISLKYLGYKSPFRYRAFMYCPNCRYWEEYL